MSEVLGHTPDRIGALRAEIDAVRGLLRTLTDDEWRSPSAASGWRVQEVAAHMAAACHGMFQPGWSWRILRSKAVERTNDRDAEARRDQEPARVLAEYERWAPRFALAQAVTAKAPGAALIKVPLGELGRFPLPTLASAFVFDHWTHLAHDMTPALNRPAPPTDANRIACVTEWMLLGCEQMCHDAMKWLDTPLALTLDGAGGGTWTITPAGGGRLRVRHGSGGGAVTHITGNVLEFPVWGTARRSWRDCDVSLAGDQEIGQRFLDSLNIV